MPRPKRNDHGTRAAYNSGCSCVPCCDANAEYMRNYRKLREQMGKPADKPLSSYD